MIIFDLQRFATDNLEASSNGFTWAGGNSFATTNTKFEAESVGTASVYAAYITTSGLSTAGTADEIYLTGSKDGATASKSFNVEGSNWEIALEDSRDVVHVSSDNGFDSILSGEVDLTVNGGRRNAFTETVNGTPVYIQTYATRNVTIEGTDANLTYTFAAATNDTIGLANDTIGLDTNDTAVFLNGATNIELKPAADKETEGVKKISFAAATVTADNSALNITMENDGTAKTISAGDEKWTVTAGGKAKSTGETTFTATAERGIAEVDGFTETVRVTPSRKGLDTVKVGDTTWNEISGIKISSATVTFDKTGNATVDGNNGEINVNGATEGSKVAFANDLSAGVTINNATIESADKNIEFELASTGIAAINADKSATSIAASVTGDDAFDVNVVKKTYAVNTTDSILSFNADSNDINITVAAGKEYDVTGGDGVFTFAGEIAANSQAEVNINDAAVVISNNTTKKKYTIESKDGKDGVEKITGLAANDEVSISGDADGYKAVFNASGTGVLTFTANGKTVSVNSGQVGSNVTLDVDSSGAVLVQGVNSNATVTVSGGATYYFNDKKAGNQVKVVSAESANVSITNDVVDYRPTKTQPALDEDDKKWQEIATIGGSSLNGGNEDTVATNRSKAFDAFYDLATGSAAGMTLAGYSSADAEEPTSVSGVINILSLDDSLAVDEAAHVSLQVNAGGGSTPLNIQSNENDNLVSAVIDFRAADKPSTVAIGTRGNVSASHEVSLSNQDGGYLYVGERATGENKLFGGTGADMIRHEGTVQATLNGGAGQDTIRGGENDIVVGGDGADYFYDTAAFALDYEVGDGDVIIASRVKSFDKITASNVRGTGNEIGFGDGKHLLKLSNVDQNDALHVKVALLDDDGNILPDTKDLVLANGNGVVSVEATTPSGALIFAGSSRGNANGVHTVIGSNNDDSIYIGANDSVNAGQGDDYIEIDEDAVNVKVAFEANSGLDTVTGWNYGFDSGKTVLDAGDAQVRARVYEDKLHISLQEGTDESSSLSNAMLFETSEKYGDAIQLHGQYNVLVGDKKYTAIRNNGDRGPGYASVTSNDEIADVYVAERNGKVYFTEGVTKNLGTITLGSENFWAIRQLDIQTNAKAQIIGSSERESVTVGGAAIQGANKEVSLGGGNDYIVSGGNTDTEDSLQAGHKFYFGAGDGRDTIENFSHYLGVNEDADKQHSDTLVIEKYTDLKVATYDDGDRIEIGTSDSDQVVLYEKDGVNTEKMYRLQVGFENEAKLAKIGFSAGGNTFAYDKKVDYYVGSSGEAHDTLTVSDIRENVDIRLDGYGDTFYRGIDYIDATAETYTNLSLGGSADNNTIIAGGEGTNNTLWGGAGDNSLVGGDGIDYFLYYYGADNYVQGGSGNAATKGNNDVVEGYNCATDFIFLNDVTIDMIDTDAMAALNDHNGIAEDAVTVKFKNGGSLTVNVTDQERVAVYMGNGAGGYDVYSAERSDGAWHKNP